MKWSFYSLILISAFFTLPLLAWDCCDSSDFVAEARVAYYHPTSKKVRHIYGKGFADYQFEFSKSFKGFENLCECGLEWRLWVGVSGFSKNGKSIGFHDHTRLQLIPVNLGLKIFYPLWCDVKAFIGGAVCYSFLNIRDHSDYVHKHVRKEGWGGLLQSGLTYQFCDWGTASLFFDYFFQRFHFHNQHHDSSYRYIYRSNLNMNGYKIGLGLGVIF